jgi:hypothetical protein
MNAATGDAAGIGRGCGSYVGPPASTWGHPVKDGAPASLSRPENALIDGGIRLASRSSIDTEVWPVSWTSEVLTPKQ